MTGLLWAAALLLAAAGVAKLARPDPTTRAAADSGIPGSVWFTRRWVVRLLGMGEVAAALAVVLAGGPRSAAALALLYAALALVAARLLREGPDRDCGCFGNRSQPVTVAHLVIDLAASAVGLAAVLWPVPGLPELVAADPWPTIALAGGAIVLAWLAYLAMTALPELSRLREKLAGAA